MEQWSSGVLICGEKRYIRFGSYHSLLKMRSIALFSIIPLLHHSLAQTWFAMVEFNWLQSRHMSAMTQCDSQVAPGQALAQTWFYWPQF